MSVRRPTVTAMGQLSFADVDASSARLGRRTSRCATRRSSSSTSRPPAAGPAGDEDGDGHDAITEIGAVKVRGGEVLGELATLVDPGRSIPPQIVALTGITTAMVCDAPTHRLGAARVPGVLPRRGAGRTQRRVRHRVPAGRRRALRAAWPRPPVLCTVQAGPPRADPRRGAERAAVGTGAAVRRQHHADPPRARRRARHRRRAARADRTGRQPGHPHLSPTCAPICPTSRPAQRRNRHLATGLPRTARACTCSAVPPTRCSTSAPRSTCAAGSASTSTAPTRAPG